jgi:hypothetical protein
MITVVQVAILFNVQSDHSPGETEKSESFFLTTFQKARYTYVKQLFYQMSEPSG